MGGARNCQPWAESLEPSLVQPHPLHRGGEEGTLALTSYLCGM